VYVEVRQKMLACQCGSVALDFVEQHYPDTDIGYQTPVTVIYFDAETGAETNSGADENV